MYSYIKGILTERTPEGIVLEAGGIGFSIAVTSAALATLPETGGEAKIYTYFQVREDAQLLYGFGSQREKAMFEKLLQVTGVGAKVAMSILSTLSPPDLALAIATNDAKSITQAPGVGRKLAERIILELREKVSNDELLSTPGGVALPGVSNAMQEAVVALQALGCDGVSAGKAVRAVAQDGMNVQTLVREALRSMDRG